VQVLAIGNQKGGTSKTTTAAALAVLLSRRGVRVHVCDIDPQSSLTSAFGRRDTEGLLYQAMMERQALPIISVSDNLTLTPSSVDLAKAESQLVAEPGREMILKDCLARSGLSDDTLVILDCPPSLGVLALNCLTAADKLLVTVQPGGFELQALARLEQTIGILRQRVNPKLETVGVVLTNCVLRRSITAQIEEEISRHYPVLGLIRADAQLLYATTAGTLDELQHSRALDDYVAVAEKLQKIVVWQQRLPV
jgi:chromosome partitioning protein